MKKMAVKILIMLCVVLLLAACAGQPAAYYPNVDDYAAIEDDIIEIEVGANQDGYYAQSPGKIAVIVPGNLTAPNPHHTQGDTWVLELIERHGQENVIVHAWPVMIDEIVQNPEIAVLIINPGWNETGDVMSMLRRRRDDIFVIYIDCRFRLRGNALYAAPYANLILEFDTDGMARAFPAAAYELGAKTLVYFYDTGGYGFEKEYVESDQHRIMREKSAEIGLSFVEIDRRGYIQCGSSFHMFTDKTIPPLLEEHGTDIVLFGLWEERTFWLWRSNGFIYLPSSRHDNWFEPTPIDIAWDLSRSDQSLIYFFNRPADSIRCTARFIEEIRNELDEKGLLGRIGSWPISSRLLLPLAAAEYGIKWMHGEVQEEGIDIHTLEQIMVDLIAEYTGLQNHGVALSVLIKDGMARENYILVLPDYIIY